MRPLAPLPPPAPDEPTAAALREALRQRVEAELALFQALLAAVRAPAPPAPAPPAATLRELEALPALVPAWPDAARLLGVGRNRMHELIRAGRVPALRLGRRCFVPRAALARLLGGGDTEP
jgi:excisionase family DNA binding protein